MLKFPSKIVRRRSRKERKKENNEGSSSSSGGSGSSSSSSSSKRVFFALNEITYIPHDDDATDHDADNNSDAKSVEEEAAENLIYYTRRDFERIRDHNNAIVKLLEDKTASAVARVKRHGPAAKANKRNDSLTEVTIDYGNGQGEEEICFRGLEHITEIGKQNRQKVVQRAVTAVLAEQDRGKNANVIAELYKGYTLSSVKTALRYGKLDAQAVKLIRKGDNEDESAASTTSCSRKKENATKKRNSNPRRYHNNRAIGGSHQEVHTHIPRSFFH